MTLVAPFLSVQNPGAPIYLDPSGGSDSNNGATSGAAVQTPAQAFSLLTNGGRLLLKAGTRLNGGQLRDFGKTKISLVKYGVGADPIVDGSVAVASGAWTADSRTNVYYADIDHLDAVQTAGVAGSSSAHFGMWSEVAGVATELQPYYEGASQAANRDYVRDHAGSFTANVRGSSQKDPRVNDAEVDPSKLRYYVHLPANADPTAGVAIVYYADYKHLLNMAAGLTVDDVTFQRNSQKDMVEQADKDNNWVRNATFLDCAMHGWLGAPARLYYVTCTGRRSAYLYGGAGVHFYRSGDTVGTTLKEVSAQHSSVTGFGVGYYSHGNGNIDEHKRVDLTSCAATDCATAIQNGQTTGGWFVDRFGAINCPNLLTAETYVLLQNLRWWSGAGDGGFLVGLSLYNGVEVVIENSALIFDTGVSNSLRYLFKNNSGNVSRCRLRFINCTIHGAKMGTVSVGHDWLNVDLTLENTIFGHVEGADPYFHDITATNSQLYVGGKTLAQMRAAWPGISSDCIEAVANPAEFLSDPEDAPYDVTLDPSCQPAIQGMGCDVSLLP